MIRSESARLGVVIFVALLAVPGTAWAYLDAGTGSMLLQAAVAAFFAAIYVLKTRWAQVRAWLSGTTLKPAAQESTAERDERSP